jgi:ATP-dependent DNA helicase DinG
MLDTEHDMKYADRFFFQQENGAVELLSSMSKALSAFYDRVEVLASFDNISETDSSTSEDLEIISSRLKSTLSEISNYLFWLERKGGNIDFAFCPKDTSGILSDLYFGEDISTILTSATLTTSGSDKTESQYAYFVSSTGFPVDYGVLSVPKPSPFPYDEHAMIYYCDDLPHPTNEHEAFIRQGTERLLDVLEISHGKALVLFTAKTDMEEVYALLSSRDLPYKILMPKPGSSQERVLQEFKRDIDSVLLGTGAYWEGIDIQGKSLSNLVIFRLQFPVPDPIIEYKASIAKDPLMEVRVPEMIIKLKQGIGRLIRSESDTGIVSIIDPRLRDRPATPYRDIAWAALPIHNKTSDLKELSSFYQKVVGR